MEMWSLPIAEKRCLAIEPVVSKGAGRAFVVKRDHHGFLCVVVDGEWWVVCVVWYSIVQRSLCSLCSSCSLCMLRVSCGWGPDGP
jgi:hypothetical protein